MTRSLKGCFVAHLLKGGLSLSSWKVIFLAYLLKGRFVTGSLKGYFSSLFVERAVCDSVTERLFFSWVAEGSVCGYSCSDHRVGKVTVDRQTDGRMNILVTVRDTNQIKYRMVLVSIPLMEQAKKPPPVTQVWLMSRRTAAIMSRRRARRFICPANTIHWTNVGLLLGRRCRRRPNINPSLVWCLVFGGQINLANTRHWATVRLMLGRRRIRWATISPKLAQCLAFAGY